MTRYNTLSIFNILKLDYEFLKKNLLDNLYFIMTLFFLSFSLDNILDIFSYITQCVASIPNIEISQVPDILLNGNEEEFISSLDGTGWHVFGPNGEYKGKYHIEYPSQNIHWIPAPFRRPPPAPPKPRPLPGVS